MILIPFVPGSFASTIEYCIRKFTEFSDTCPVTETAPMSDGSMHGFGKFMHIVDSTEFTQVIERFKNTDIVITPIYPFRDLHAQETFEIINKTHSDTDKVITVFIENKEMAEINMLFQYHKICVGLGSGLDIFFNTELSNKHYSTWAESGKLDIWQRREWFSLFYPGWIQEWLDVKSIEKVGYSVSSSQLLDNPKETLTDIFAYCGFERIAHQDLEEFINDWRKKQQYVIDEFNKIKEFVDCVVNNEYYLLEHKSIIAESIIQHKLHERGFGIKCWNLNVFPSQAQDLHKLLEKL